jgi:hypothetical protein
MSIPVKIISGTESGTIKKGNFAFGVSKNRTYGPTSETGFYKGHTIPDGGYVVYLDRGTASPSAYVCGNDSDLISTVNAVSGENYQTVSDAVSWVNTQSGAVAFDKPFNSIVTDGLVLNLDAGNLISYSGTGSTWYDVSGVENNGTLTNGPTFNSNGFLEFDGIDDVVFLPSSNSLTGNNLQTLTMSTLIKFTTTSTGYAFAIKRSGGDSTLITITVNQNTSGTQNQSGFLGYLIRNQADTQHNYLTINNGYNDGRWHQVVARVDGNTRTLFIDGQNMLESGGGMQSVTGNTALATLGSFGSSFYFNGSISNSYFYRISLSNSEILQNYYQAPIVTDGLVFAVDAGNLVSYENGSTTVYNLSGTQSGTLINGVGYSKNKGGIWIFDGTDDRIPTDFSISGVESTIQISVKPIANSVGYYIAQSGGAVDGEGRFLINTFNTLNNDFTIRIGSNTLNTTGGFNQWFILTVRRDSNGLTTFYKNNQIVGTFTNTTPFVSGRILDIGGSTFVSNRTINGSIGNVLIYNRALTPEEISQNFEAERQRFGI